jgi:hypothetical protein
MRDHLYTRRGASTLRTLVRGYGTLRSSNGQARGFWRNKAMLCNAHISMTAGASARVRGFCGNEATLHNGHISGRTAIRSATLLAGTPNPKRPTRAGSRA